MRERHRVAILGLDCASPHLIFDRWREQLPTFSRLMREGIYAPLRSTDPPITVPAWTSMVTSKDPGQLGCYGFRNRKDHSYDDLVMADSRSVREPTLWKILSRNRKRSIVLGVPQTYPPQPLRGLLASDFLAPDEGAQFTYPPEFRHVLDRMAGGYILDVKDFRTEDKERLAGQVREMTRRRFRAVRHLMANEAWDFLMVVEMGPDRMHHAFWKYFDPDHPKYVPGNPLEGVMKEYYRLLDEELAVVLELLHEDDTLFVVSDHGARPMMGGVCINEWLRHKGHLRLLSNPSGPTRFAPSLVDWDRTRAWSEGGYYARVFLNVRGREPRGVIPAEDYNQFREDLAQELTEMEDLMGRPIGNRVLVPEEIYRDCRGVPPDLIVYLGDLSYRSIGSVGAGELYTSENDTGPDDANHDPHGIFMLYEPWRSRHRGERSTLDILDVAPTVLDRMGIPIPSDMLGQVVKGEADKEIQ